MLKAPQDFNQKVFQKVAARKTFQARRKRFALAFAAFLLVLSGLSLFLNYRAKSSSMTTFELDAPRANSVAVAGDFTDWKMTPLRGAEGHWQLSLSLGAGRHEYVFVLNGHRTLPDPRALEDEDDATGLIYSVLEVPTKS